MEMSFRAQSLGELRPVAARGEVCEWLKQRSWKDRIPEMVSRVRIPPSPRRNNKAPLRFLSLGLMERPCDRKRKTERTKWSKQTQQVTTDATAQNGRRNGRNHRGDHITLRFWFRLYPSCFFRQVPNKIGSIWYITPQVLFEFRPILPVPIDELLN